MICVLNMLGGPSIRSSYVLRENQHVEIGRSSKVDISLPSDCHLSRRHVSVDCGADGFSICDLGSINGTYLNDRRIQRAALKHGDVIRIGMTQFRVAMIDSETDPLSEEGLDLSGSYTEGTRFDSVGEPKERSVCFPNEVAGPGTMQSVSQGDGWGRDSVVNLSGSPPFSDLFSCSDEPNLYAYDGPDDSPWGAFVGLLTMLSPKTRILCIVNTSQVPSGPLAVLEKSLLNRVSLSKTLLAGYASLAELDVSVLTACASCDGLICMGSAKWIDPDELKEFANAFSYPSLFGEKIQDPGSRLRKFLLRRRAWVLFEWSRTRPIGLFSSVDL